MAGDTPRTANDADNPFLTQEELRQRAASQAALHAAAAHAAATQAALRHAAHHDASGLAVATVPTRPRPPQRNPALPRSNSTYSRTRQHSPGTPSTAPATPTTAPHLAVHATLRTGLDPPSSQAPSGPRPLPTPATPQRTHPPFHDVPAPPQPIRNATHVPAAFEVLAPTTDDVVSTPSIGHEKHGTPQPTVILNRSLPSNNGLWPPTSSRIDDSHSDSRPEVIRKWTTFADGSGTKDTTLLTSSPPSPLGKAAKFKSTSAINDPFADPNADSTNSVYGKSRSAGHFPGSASLPSRVPRFTHGQSRSIDGVSSLLANGVSSTTGVGGNNQTGISPIDGTAHTALHKSDTELYPIGHRQTGSYPNVAVDNSHSAHSVEAAFNRAHLRVPTSEKTIGSMQVQENPFADLNDYGSEGYSYTYNGQGNQYATSAISDKPAVAPTTTITTATTKSVGSSRPGIHVEISKPNPSIPNEQLYPDGNDSPQNPFEDDTGELLSTQAPPLPIRPTRQEVLQALSPAYQDTNATYQPSVSPALPARPITPRLMGARSINAIGDSTLSPLGSSPVAASVPAGESMYQSTDERYMYLRNREVYKPDYSDVNRRPPTAAHIGCVDPVIRGTSNAKVARISNGIVVTGLQHVRAYDINSGEMLYSYPVGELKVSAIGFPPSKTPEESGKILWVGLQGGEVLEFDAYTGQLLNRRLAHTSSVLHMLTSGIKYITLDDQGGMRIWNFPVQLSNQPKTLRVLGRPICATITNDTLWCACGKIIEIYYYPDTEVTPVAPGRVSTNFFNAQNNISDSSSSTTGSTNTGNNSGNNTNVGFQLRHDLGSTVGNVSVLTASPSNNLVLSGHDDGKVIVWNATTLQRIRVVGVGFYKITSLVSLSDYEMWVSFHTGKMQVIRTGDNIVDPTCAWTVTKDFTAYSSGAVESLSVDFSALMHMDRLIICSLGDTGLVRLWDGLLTRDWVEDRLRTQREQYCTNRMLKILICSWNCNATKPGELEMGTPDDVRFLKSWLSATDGPDMIVVGLQELVNLESKAVNAKEILKKKKHQQVDNRVKVWKETLTTLVRQAQPNDAYFIAQLSQLMGLFQCILIKESLRESLHNISMHTVKTGMGGYHGNKGGIATRLIIDDTSFCFINCHLAAHQNQVSARNSDAMSILKEATFPLVNYREDVFVHGGDGRQVMDHEHVFFSGDLNYRIDLDRQHAVDLVEAEQWEILQAYDQLLKQMPNQSFALHGFLEGELCFPPTFKYDIGSDRYDTSEKKRVPSWCDRILFNSTGVRLVEYRRAVPWPVLSDHRPIYGVFEADVRQIDAMKYPKHVAKAKEAVLDYISDKVMRLRADIIAQQSRVRPSTALELLTKYFGDVSKALSEAYHLGASGSGI